MYFGLNLEEVADRLTPSLESPDLPVLTAPAPILCLKLSGPHSEPSASHHFQETMEQLAVRGLSLYAGHPEGPPSLSLQINQLLWLAG